MTQTPCKRFRLGAIGITLTPRKQRSGEYFWTFEFSRSFKRSGSETWEYAKTFSQRDAEALELVMSQAFQFMEQNRPAQFVEEWEANRSLEEQSLPSVEAAASS